MLDDEEDSVEDVVVLESEEVMLEVKEEIVLGVGDVIDNVEDEDELELLLG